MGEDIVETVARAICQEWMSTAYKGHVIPWDDLARSSQEAWMMVADAAITAYRTAREDG